MKRRGLKSESKDFNRDSKGEREAGVKHTIYLRFLSPPEQIRASSTKSEPHTNKKLGSQDGHDNIIVSSYTMKKATTSSSRLIASSRANISLSRISIGKVSARVASLR